MTDDAINEYVNEILQGIWEELGGGGDLGMDYKDLDAVQLGLVGRIARDQGMSQKNSVLAMNLFAEAPGYQGEWEP